MRQVVLVNGPIASGKTTVARLLADLVRSKGHKAASIDLDDLVWMNGGTDWLRINRQHWQVAREGAAVLVNWLFASGTSLVAVAGPFFDATDRAQLIDALDGSPRTTIVTLRVSLPEAIRRAQADPTRLLSKNPDLLTKLYDSIDWRCLPSDGLEFVTEGRPADTTVEDIAYALRL